VAQRRLTDEPVLAFRALGQSVRTTLLRGSAAAHGTAVIDLDDFETRDAVAADPAIFVSGQRQCASMSINMFLPSSTRSRLN
jgi:hypothetical protein